ncbi:MAG: YHYH protein [Chthoniobacteraceae bacterium]
MKAALPILLIGLLADSGSPAKADPQLSSWLETYSTKYARIYTTDTNKTSGTSVTTWTNGTQNQSLPAYAGVQDIYYSTSWIYLRTTGMASHIMGPWYLNSAHTSSFPNYPINEDVLFRIPRTSTLTTAPSTKTLTTLGAIGYFVDGVAMYDSRDGYVWTGSTESSSGTGYWNREAYKNEGVTFDPGYAHQDQSGTYHYHADPIALRYQLGDHVDFNSSTKAYTESTTTATKHSPILGWVADGYPVYGPYGYSSALDATSSVRRMISGYQLRDGTNGSDNLTSTGRTTIPAWAQRLYSVSASQSGPNVSTTYPLGRYMEDYLYLGDLGKVQGTDFDLDVYNGRYCVTPEFPNGTYAYFVSIDTSGTPVFPNNIGRAFYGNVTGGTKTVIPETVKSYFAGGENAQEVASVSNLNTTSGDVTITWSSTEGGTYQVQATSNLTSGSWSTLTSSQAATSNDVSTSYVESGGASTATKRYYKVTRTALASHDLTTTDATSSSGTSTSTTQGVASLSPNSASAGTKIAMAITMNSSYVPAPPSAANPPTSITLTKSGATTITASSATRDSSTGTIYGVFSVPSTATTGTYTLNVVFNSHTWSFTNGFTVN